jgi:hypothetical protein
VSNCQSTTIKNVKDLLCVDISFLLYTSTVSAGLIGPVQIKHVPCLYFFVVNPNECLNLCTDSVLEVFVSNCQSII